MHLRKMLYIIIQSQIVALYFNSNKKRKQRKYKSNILYLIREGHFRMGEQKSGKGSLGYSFIIVYSKDIIMRFKLWDNDSYSENHENLFICEVVCLLLGNPDPLRFGACVSPVTYFSP